MNRRQRRKALAQDPRLAGKHIDRGIKHLNQGQVDKAAEYFEKALALRPRHAEAHNNLGLALKDLGKPHEAEQRFKKALALKPGFVEAYSNLGLVLKIQGRYDEAIAWYRKAIELRPDFGDAYGNLANVYEQTNRMEAAKSTIERGLAVAPAHPFLNLIAARCERREGRAREAIDRLGKFRPTALPRILAKEFNFELGRLHDRAGNAEKAYDHFTAGNGLAMPMASIHNVDRDRFLRIIDAANMLFTEENVGSWRPAPDFDEAESPVFLVGFPRSGTTLLEEILDSHPNLRSLSERLTVATVQNTIAALPKGYPRALADLTPGQIEQLRSTYFDAVDELIERRPGQIVVDKQPLNFVHAGLIWRMFPKAKFVMMVRHPCDACLSCFMQNFAMNNAMANFFTLEDTVALYVKAMALWRQYLRALPLNYHVVKYELLVDGFDSEIRRLLDFLGVGWHDDVRDYASRAVERGQINTPSYHQVAEPIYSHAKYRWQRYADRFAPLMDQLAPCIEYFGYAPV